MLGALALLSVLALPQGERWEVAELSLAIDFSGVEDFEGSRDRAGQSWGRGSGSISGTPVSFDLTVLDRKVFDEFSGPGDVAEVYSFNAGNRARREGRAGGFQFEVSRALPGTFGEVPFGWFSVEDRVNGAPGEEARVVGHEVIVSGLTPDFGYMLEIVSETAIEQEGVEAIARWAQGAVAYDGPVLDPRWTDEEAEARFWEDAPKAIADRLRRRNERPTIARTEHYIVFTDLGRKTLEGFEKVLEENYDHIRSVFPFDELEGERLMPVFYFKRSEHYRDWWVETLEGGDERARASARRSAGVAAGDVYATYHQSTTDPVHIHEQTHQIFRNRLRLTGGGSWFQEGVAEYMSSKPGDLGAIKRLSRREGGLVPMADLMVVPSLLMSPAGSRRDGRRKAALAYTHAASIVEFCKHSTFGKERFLDWVHAIGRVGPGDLPAIEAAIARIYGVSLDEFEAAFRAYWHQRGAVKDWHAPG